MNFEDTEKPIVKMKNQQKSRQNVGKNTEKEKDNMRKLKKSLAVLLAVLMLTSLMPMFASAATAMSKANATLIEAPKFSYNGGEPTSNLIVPEGTTKADIEVVGGKIAYEGTEVEGFFSWASQPTATPSTSVLAVGDINVILYFHPTDITNYSRGSWSSTATAPIEGWPTLAVDGLDATIIEAPTVSGFLPTDSRLNTLTLSGGKVVDADGNDITASGTWSFVNATAKPTESGEQQVQWKLKGYDVPKTTVYVTVKTVKTTLAEKPVMSTIILNDNLYRWRKTSSKLSGGKVLDEDGVEITDGKWTLTYPEGLEDVYDDTEITATWTKAGYESITTTLVIPVAQNHSVYNIKSGASFALSGQKFVYSPDITFDNIEIIPANITDKAGNPVEGRYSVRMGQSATGKDLTGPIPSSSATIYYITFTPTDSTLPILYFSDSFGIISKADFTLSEDSEIVVMYGEDDVLLSETYDQLKYSTLKTIPEEAGVSQVNWSVTDFDPSTADYGTVAMVEVTVKSINKSYNDQVLTVPVRIMNYVHDNSNPWYISSNTLSFTSTQEESYDGIRNYKVDFTNKRLKGTVDLYVNDEVFISVSPDENGRFYAEGQWIAPESGDYTYRFEYKPTDEDSATVENPVYPLSGNRAFTMDIRPYHTLTVKVNDKTYTITERYKSMAAFKWQDETGLGMDDFDSWVFTDENGKEIIPENVESVDGDPRTNANIYIVMPDYDVTATMKNQSSIGDDISGGGDAGDGTDDDADNGIFGGIWSFFQKLINWFINIIKQMMSLFAPKA